MFEVTTNLWLQQWQAPWLLAWMELVSLLGRGEAYLPMFLLLAFGFRFRQALAVLLAMVIAGALTHAIKLGAALPRPSEVDARVLDKGEAGQALVERGAAESFFGLPSEAAIAAVRAAGAMDYGFVSGHASAATAFALGIALFLARHRRWAWTLAVAWALMMGLSRLYLGRHFLGDVLGGWLLGGACLWASWWFVQQIDRGPQGRAARAWTLALLALGAWTTASLFALPVSAADAGSMAGVLACLWVLSRVAHGDAAPLRHRALRVVCALLLAYGVDAAITTVWDATGLEDGHPLAFASAFAGYTAALLGAWWLCRRLGLYQRPVADGRVRVQAQ